MLSDSWQFFIYITLGALFQSPANITPLGYTVFCDLNNRPQVVFCIWPDAPSLDANRNVEQCYDISIPSAQEWSMYFNFTDPWQDGYILNAWAYCNVDIGDIVFPKNISLTVESGKVGELPYNHKCKLPVDQDWQNNGWIANLQYNGTAAFLAPYAYSKQFLKENSY